MKWTNRLLNCKRAKQFGTLWLALILSSMAPMKAEAFSILIDPGHGGEDVGARHQTAKGKASEVLEKNITLEIALKIYEILKKDYTVYLTRSVDRTVSLEQRADMAEKMNVDLFISVHANSSLNHLSKGIETYYLDNHNDVAIRKVERVENPRLTGNDLIANNILIDLIIQRTVSTSKALAETIHTHLKEKVGQGFAMEDRGVRPGLFYVLALSKRPAVLLEAGFVSNAKESKLLMNESYQDAYAEAVASGIKAFVKGKKIQQIAQL